MSEMRMTKLVPLKPTPEMCIAGYNAAKIGYWEDRVKTSHFSTKAWEAMTPLKYMPP